MLYGSRFGIALIIFAFIIFFDLKNGPIKDVILLEIFEANFKPKILNIKKKVIITKN
jgi:hypothetical protein